MAQVEIWANQYPSNISKLELKGIEVKDHPVNSNWKLFILPKGWRLKNYGRGVEHIYDAYGSLCGKYTITYKFGGEERKIHIF